MLKFLLSDKVIQPIMIILFLSVIYFIMNRIIRKVSKTRFKGLNQKKNKTILSLINNLMKYFLIIIGFIMILNVYGVNTNSIIASLGVASAVIALAFQDTLKDFLAGIFIIIENQYDIGDTVTINNFKGEVVSVGLRTTKLKSFNGEYCFIANHNVGDVINHSLTKSLAIVKFQVSYQENLDKVEKVLNDLAQRLNKELSDLKGPIVIDGVDELADSGITYRLSVETTPLKNIEVQRKMLREIKQEFDKNKIEIPFPQVVIHND